MMELLKSIVSLGQFGEQRKGCLELFLSLSVVGVTELLLLDIASQQTASGALQNVILFFVLRAFHIALKTTADGVDIIVDKLHDV